jgi:hypothetical protein
LAKEIGCKFIETSSGLDHNVDELLVGIVAQVKLNPQRIRNLSEKQRNSLCMTGQQKYKGAPDHFTELRRNERNKSNNLKDAARGKSKAGKAANKENLDDDLEDESDDERSSDDEVESATACRQHGRKLDGHEPQPFAELEAARHAGHEHALWRREPFLRGQQQQQSAAQRQQQQHQLVLVQHTDQHLSAGRVLDIA